MRICARFYWTYAHKSRIKFPVIKKATNLTLNRDLVTVFAEVILPRTKFKSLSKWVNNEMLKLARARANDLRKAKTSATGEQIARINRALEFAFPNTK